MVESKRQGEARGGESMEQGRGGQEQLERGRSANPLVLIDQLTQEMDRMFADFWRAPFGRAGRARRAGGRDGGEVANVLWTPEIEVHEHDGEIVVRADLPGLKSEDVQVEVADQVLTIQGERKQECAEEREGWHRTECRYGSFFRSIPLGEGIDPEKVQARFEDGVLEIRMHAPRRQEARKRIEVRGAEPRKGEPRKGETERSEGAPRQPR